MPVDPRSYTATVHTECPTCSGVGSLETTETRIDTGRQFRNVHTEDDGTQEYVWGEMGEAVVCVECGDTVVIVPADEVKELA